MLTLIGLYHSMTWPYNPCLTRSQHSSLGREEMKPLSPVNPLAPHCNACLVCLHTKSSGPSCATFPVSSKLLPLIMLTSKGKAYRTLSWTEVLKTLFPYKQVRDIQAVWPTRETIICQQDDHCLYTQTVVLWIRVWLFESFPCGSSGKEFACSAGDLGSIPGLGRSPGGGKGYPLQYSGLENSRGCIVHVVAKSRTRVSNLQFHFDDYFNRHS